MKITAYITSVLGLILMVYGWYYERFEINQSMFWGFITIVLSFLVLSFIDIEGQFPSIDDNIE